MKESGASYDQQQELDPIDNLIQCINEGSDVDDHYNFDPFPVGYRFLPTDVELLDYFLRGKILNQPLPPTSVYDLPVYDFTPMQLKEFYQFLEGELEEVMYFFTQRKMKHAAGNYCDRTANGGRWKVHGPAEEVNDEDDDEKIIGYKRRLCYYRFDGENEIKTNWMMYEYTFDYHRSSKSSSPPETPSTAGSTGANQSNGSNWVLCKIYQLPEKNKSKELHNKIQKS